MTDGPRFALLTYSDLIETDRPLDVPDQDLVNDIETMNDIVTEMMTIDDIEIEMMTNGDEDVVHLHRNLGNGHHDETEVTVRILPHPEVEPLPVVDPVARLVNDGGVIHDPVHHLVEGERSTGNDLQVPTVTLRPIRDVAGVQLRTIALLVGDEVLRPMIAALLRNRHDRPPEVGRASTVGQPGQALDHSLQGRLAQSRWT